MEERNAQYGNERDRVTDYGNERDRVTDYGNERDRVTDYGNERDRVTDYEKCQKENTFVVLIIPVSPGNVAARDAIRSTWGSEKVVADKTNAQYAMKIDSDMFLNVKNLVNLLLPAPKQNYMTGLVARNAMVLRDPHSKWYLPITAYSPFHYPPYALGLGYVFSLDLAGKLIEAAQHVKAVYIEDVFVGMCMKHLGIDLTNPPDGSLFNVFPVDYNRCHYSKLIATTTRSLENIVNFWRDLQTPGPYC
ncbi:UDP-GalNAc:beta-1,3-N-acetylgalactosaminyltransferase 1 isoform b [Pimephales promelas]|nr:UDP-GalNAc:beta-1,3-N-acetylgalactosaminyltransferase 1 isoform b [Pimephales promelas]